MATTADVSQNLFCPRHPKVETRLRCGRCNAIICPKCMVPTEVGQRCLECGKGRRLPTYQFSSAYFFRGLVAGLITGAACSAVWFYAFAFGFWIALLTGFVTGEAVARAGNMRRGPAMMAAGAVSVVAGYVVVIVGLALLAGGGTAAVSAGWLGVFLWNPYQLVLLGIAAAVAAVRQRG